MTKLGRKAPSLLVFLFGTLVSWAQPGTEGHVNFLEYANSSFDAYTQNPSISAQQWFQSHFFEMVAWSPYFDAKTSWFPNTLVYTDLYGILQGSWVQYAHPEWILKDQYGNWLYIPYWCNNGTCPEYAADVANPAFRAWWIQQAQATIAAGNYRGIFLDDTNMAFRVSDGSYNQVAPIDSNTGQPMTYDAWRYYIAQFTSQIRAALPYANILENVIWYAGPAPTYDQDPYIQQQLKSATQVNLERGVASDPGLTGGTGFWSVYSFFSYVDRVHALGKGVNFEQYQLDSAGQEYGLASYFMISNGTDSLGDARTNPTNWFSGYSVDLGPALGPRTYNNGVYQRNFTRGIVLMGEPGLSPQTITLPGSFQRLSGSWVNSVSLSGSQGIILQGTASSSTSPTTASGGWSGLGGVLNGNAAVGRNADGRLEAFVRGGDNALWHIWQTSVGGPWSGWSSLGGTLASNPAVATNADGRLEVFAVGGDSALWHVWQTAAGGSWSGWGTLGGAIQNDPSVAVNADGRLEVFAQAGDTSLWDIHQVSAGGAWSAWTGIGGSFVGRPTSVTNLDGRLEVFVHGSDNALWHVWQITAGGPLSAWTSLGGAIGASPAIGIDTDGRLEAFTQGSNGGLWDDYQTAPNGSWAPWVTLAGAINASPAVNANADGRLEVFVRGLDNALWHAWQTSPGGTWSGWSSLGGSLGDGPSTARNADGRLEVFVRGSDNSFWHIAQSTPGSW